MITPDNYMGWMNIFINEIIGSPILFILGISIVISYICVVNSISTVNTVALIGVWVILSATLYYNVLFVGIPLIIIGGLIYMGYNKSLSKQG